MFECLQVEDYKRYIKGRNARVRSGKCVMRYYVALNNAGRAVWVRDPHVWYWATGYEDCEKKCKTMMKWRVPSLSSLKYIQTADNGKLVTKTEAKKLLGSHWLPQAALDHITEQLDTSRVLVTGEATGN